MLFFIEVTLSGMMAGVMYSLVALGFVLIFRSSRIFNFAQGIMVVFAALTLVGLHAAGLPAWLAFAGTLLVMFVLAVGIERDDARRRVVVGASEAVSRRPRPRRPDPLPTGDPPRRARAARPRARGGRRWVTDQDEWNRVGRGPLLPAALCRAAGAARRLLAPRGLPLHRVSGRRPDDRDRAGAPSGHRR